MKIFLIRRFHCFFQQILVKMNLWDIGILMLFAGNDSKGEERAEALIQPTPKGPPGPVKGKTKPFTCGTCQKSFLHKRETPS